MLRQFRPGLGHIASKQLRQVLEPLSYKVANVGQVSIDRSWALRQQPIGDASQLILQTGELGHHGRRVVALCDLPSYATDFLFQFFLALPHPSQLAG